MESPQATGHPTVAPGSRGTVLVVENHAISQDVAKAVVARLGYWSDGAGDGFEALEALERRSYDAVLMDCHMPGMDGFEATAEIRRREAGQRHVPIIAITAGGLIGDPEKCLAVGMDDCLLKPVDERDLDAVLDRWVRGEEPPSGGVPTAAKQSGAVTGGPGQGGPGGGDVLNAAQFDSLRRLAAASRDAHFLRSFVDQYVDHAACRLAELRDAAERADAPALKALAHSLKGTSATMGASRVAAACAAVEEAAARGQAVEPGELETLAAELERATVALRCQAPPSRS